MNQFDPYSGRRPTALLGASLAALLSLPLHAADVDGQRIANADAEPGNWMSHGRDYGEQRYSPLKNITDENVDKLGLAWSYKLDIDRGVEATPIVVDGVTETFRLFHERPTGLKERLDVLTHEYRFGDQQRVVE